MKCFSQTIKDKIMKEYKTKLLIIGSGPAGATAAIYAARANLSPIMVCGMQPGGQLTITTDVENYPGFEHAIKGPWLMEQMEKQAINVGTEIIHDTIESVDFSSRPFIATSMMGSKYIADSIIIATGAQAKWLGLESEKQFQGFGVSGCATCDGFFFKNQKVMVIGGGNTAVEEALYLTNHASHVLLVHRRDSLRSEKILQDRLFKNPKIEVIWNHHLKEVIGNMHPKTVTGALLANSLTGEEKKVDIDGIFIAIGHKPNTQIFEGVIDMDAEGYIITRPGTTKTNIEGVFAAGDVQDKIYRQAVTAAGTGCMAALEAEKFLAL
jgi:thioredoxin reductase (NADPH)